MSRDLGSNSGHHSPGTFRIVFGQVQLLLQLGINRFADEPQPIKLRFRLLGTDGLLVHLHRGEQLHRAILLQEVLEGRVIVGSVSKQTLEVMRKRIEQFHHGLVIVATGGSKREERSDFRATSEQSARRVNTGTGVRFIFLRSSAILSLRRVRK
mgnify:CR=1 FL=1